MEVRQRRSHCGAFLTETTDVAQLARDSADTLERARKEANQEGAGKEDQRILTR
jgi:hypothetical protein